MSNRHRRTRIYGANYDIGESYYKKQLNDLDNKTTCNRNINTSVGFDTLNDNKTSPKVSFMCSDSEYNDKALRLPRVNTKFSDFEDEDHKTFPKQLTEHKHFSDYENEFLNGTSKPKVTDVNVDNAVSRCRKDLAEDLNRSFLKYSFANESTPMDFEKKAVSSVSVRSKYVYDNVSIKEKAEDDYEASRRVNATKARLHDLEEEITSMTNKQNEREKRKQNLKKILSLSSNNENVE
ncbi:uncharacterized protein LOC119601789 [Lucilia sericata]|uniref:uncharacterized protein LOC119601789 n=1 Tax=Lucilia sericata TaxID=13632 RepID=UPI0018A800C2|nr:uncharacterized protein LOC119601789 [Lucilia sericata]XP_037808857.1 uncharacterized protein LOC119601789 [Lucilia sericata]XP_037808858.1 uncharacterized protein LOC119601789 [Lucilia sericata]XP_037808859.1 uncharacterized protein LOC119601789 [Lucilia sericata]XP_037808860.1 uncharacterized protein LOC119601789 [Lucilia sericata]